MTQSSGNVFADLGLAKPDELLAKAELLAILAKTADARGLTQKELAVILEVDQPKISKLLRGVTEGFSTGRILGFLTKLGQDVEITVRTPSRAGSRMGTLSVKRVAARRAQTVKR